MLPPKELNSKDFQFQDDSRTTYMWQKDGRKIFFFFKCHSESIIAQKTEILVSDISVRFSCQISRGKGYLKVNAYFFAWSLFSICFKATVIIRPMLLQVKRVDWQIPSSFRTIYILSMWRPSWLLLGALSPPSILHEYFIPFLLHWSHFMLFYYFCMLVS